MERIGNVLKVTYFYGRRHAVYIPIKLQPADRTFLYKEDKVLDITQQGGVPYLVSAEDFEAQKIVLSTLAEDYTFEGKLKPHKE